MVTKNPKMTIRLPWKWKLLIVFNAKAANPPQSLTDALLAPHRGGAMAVRYPGLPAALALLVSALNALERASHVGGFACEEAAAAVHRAAITILKTIKGGST